MTFMQPNIDDALVKKVIDKLHESVACGGLRGNQMPLIYEELRNEEIPKAKEIVKKMKLPGLCRASGGRLQFIPDKGSGWICRIVEGELAGNILDSAIMTEDANVPDVPAALAPEEKKKKKKGKNKEKKKKDPPWTEYANIPESVVTAMVGLVQETEVEEQIKVHLHQHVVDLSFGAKREFFKLVCEAENMKSAYRNAFIREVQKGIAEVNKEKLYEGDDQEQEHRLKVLRDEICPQQTGNISLYGIKLRLRDRAKDLNVTTTDLGRALAGSSILRAAVDQSNGNTSNMGGRGEYPGGWPMDPQHAAMISAAAAQAAHAAAHAAASAGVPAALAAPTHFAAPVDPAPPLAEAHLPDTDDTDNQRLIAKATVLCSPDDYITGYTCRSRDTGHVVEAQEHARRLDDRSRRGENRLVVDLGRAGYPPNLYRTEEQVTEDGETKATPDILFNDLQTIGGKQVRWIDAKSACVIPGVTPERVITALRAQVEKYVREFGPGAILWTKCGFCKDVLSGVEGVSHFRPNANSHGQPPRERQAGPSRSSVPDERDFPPVGRLDPRQAFAAPGSASRMEAHQLIDRLGKEGVQEFGIIDITGFNEVMAPFYRYVQDRERRGQTTGGTQVTSEEDMREQRLRRFS